MVHGISHNVYGLVRIDIDICCLKMTKKPENVFHKNCSRYKIIISAWSSKSLNTQSKCQFRKPDFFNLLRPNVKIARTHDMMMNGIQEEELATLHMLLQIQRVNIQKQVLIFRNRCWSSYIWCMLAARINTSSLVSLFPAITRLVYPYIIGLIYIPIKRNNIHLLTFPKCLYVSFSIHCELFAWIKFAVQDSVCSHTHLPCRHHRTAYHGSDELYHLFQKYS